MVNAWHVEAVYFDVALIMNTSLLAVMTYHELCSSILILIAVLFPTLFRLGALKLFKLSSNGESVSKLMVFALTVTQLVTKMQCH